jgi:hypothetical protein
MAGRSLSRARAEAELERIRSANDTPTPARTEPAPYTHDLCDEAILLADIGMIGAELAAHWAVSEETMAEWEKAHQAFADALQRARTRARAWWQRQPRLAIRAQDNKFPAGAWSQQVRALFPAYDDRTPIHIDLGQLVIIQRSRPEPLQERAADGAKLLIEGEAVRPRLSLTGQGSAEPSLSDGSDGPQHSDEADTGPAGG